MSTFIKESPIQNSIVRIIDVFACTDGGVELVKVKTAMLNLEKLAYEGDDSAQHLVSIILQFERLVNILAQRK